MGSGYGRKYALPFAVFFTGACVLAIEIVAVRALSPHFGSTIYTVSSVISVILFALSLGYYFGGTYADRHPSAKRFFLLIAISGVAVLIFHALRLVLLPSMGQVLPLTSGPLIAALILFFAPAFILGMLSPYAVKLYAVARPLIGIGSSSGIIFFWSTAGSITGSLLAGFVLIPQVGVDRIFIGTGMTLILLGVTPLMLLGYSLNRLSVLLFLGISISFGTTFIAEASDKVFLYSDDGVYEKITIYNSEIGGRPTRYFIQDRSNSGAMFLDTKDPTDLVFDYTKYYELYELFKPDLENALVIGGGAYSIPKALLAKVPDVSVDVVEIEPSLFSLAQKYFELTVDPRLDNHVVDGRRFLRDTDTRYDLIFSDVYYSLFSSPSHFTTREFFELSKERLSEDGVFVANLIGDLSRRSPSLALSEIRTFQSVYPNSYIFAADSPGATGVQNLMLVGLNSEKKIPLDTEAVRTHENELIRSLKEKELDLNRFNVSLYDAWSDNYAPVEYATAALMGRQKTDPFYDGEEMLATIKQQLSYGSRAIGSEGHREMVQFLRAELTTYAPEVVSQSFTHTGKNGTNYELENVIARFDPDNPRRVVLGTHYDTKAKANLDTKDTSNFVPGANDGASGVAALLEVARALHSGYGKPTVGVDVVFFDGEEGEVDQTADYSNWKPLGSTHFASELTELYGEEKPISAVVLDMVCDKDLRIFKDKNSLLEAPTETEAFFAVAQKINSDAFRDQSLYAIVDDHTPLNAAGIPSFLVIDYDYSHFHTTDDTLDKCSGESLETVGRAVSAYLETL